MPLPPFSIHGIYESYNYTCTITYCNVGLIYTQGHAANASCNVACKLYAHGFRVCPDLHCNQSCDYSIENAESQVNCGQDVYIEHERLQFQYNDV